MKTSIGVKKAMADFEHGLARRRTMKSIELTTVEMEALRTACSHMEGKEFMRIGERVSLHDGEGAEMSKVMALLYRDLWVRLYRLQYGVDPKPLTDAATCTG